MFARLLAFFRRDTLHERLQTELELHQDLLTEKNIRAGMPAEEARRQARLAVGGISQVRDDVSDARGFGVLEDLVHDTRYGLRQLRRAPGFTAAAILTLALGIGANAAIFSVVDASLLRPLPLPAPDRLVRVGETAPAQPAPAGASYPDYFDWQQHSTVFAGMAAFDDTNVTLTGSGAPERLSALRVTASFFDTLGTAPALGRTFTADEEKAAGTLAILSDAFWRSNFGADPGVLGRVIRLNDVPHTVIGLMPPELRFLYPEIDVYLPVAPTPAELVARRRHVISVVARLKEGVDIEGARADLALVARRVAEADPAGHRNAGIGVVSLQRAMVGPVGPLLMLLLAAVGVVLLIACANVANLMLARAATRTREMAVRRALGATRTRLVRQVLTEGLVLALAAGLLGSLWAHWGVQLLVAAIPANLRAGMPYLQAVAIDARVLLFTILVSVLTGVLFGLIPALRASRGELQQSLKHADRTVAARHTAQQALVAGEIALGVMLLAGSALVSVSLLRLLRTDAGFRTENLLTMAVNLPAGYSQPGRARAFHDELMNRVQALPGVEGAATTNAVSLTGGSAVRFRVTAGGSEDEQQVESYQREVSAGYFRVMAIPLRRGRLFSERGLDAGKNVVILNEFVAQRLFPGVDPIGRRIRFGADAPEEREVIGVVGNEKVMALDAGEAGVVYFPYDNDRGLALIVRASGDPAAVAASVRQVVHSLEPEVPVGGFTTMDEIISGSRALFLRRYPAILIGAFTFLALVLALVGVYGVVSYTVTQWTREIGIRMALGAQTADVLRFVLRPLALATAAGAIVGIAAIFALGGLLRSFLFEVSPADPLLIALTAAAMAVSALVAGYLPARRAARINPMVALRME